MFKPVKKLNETFEYFVIYDIFRNFYILIESSISPAQPGPTHGFCSF